MKKIFTEKLYVRIKLASVSLLDLFVKKDNRLYISSEKIQSITEGNFRFLCNGCGDCCRGGGNVHFSEEELLQLKDFVKLNDEKWNLLKNKLIQFKKNGLYIHSSSKACIFIDSENKCRIYPVRPLQCRSYPYWESVFEDKKELEKHMKKCPGFSEESSAIPSRKIARRINFTTNLFNKQQSDPQKPLTL